MKAHIKVTEAHGLLHGGETSMRPGKRRKLEPESAEALAERNKASVRAKVEHPFPTGDWRRTRSVWRCFLAWATC